MCPLRLRHLSTTLLKINRKSVDRYYFLLWSTTGAVEVYLSWLDFSSSTVVTQVPENYLIENTKYKALLEVTIFVPRTNFISEPQTCGRILRHMKPYFTLGLSYIET
jgi:hypothetical protein